MDGVVVVSYGTGEVIECLRYEQMKLYLAGKHSTYQSHGLPSEVYNCRFQSPGWLTTFNPHSGSSSSAIRPLAERTWWNFAKSAKVLEGEEI